MKQRATILVLLLCTALLLCLGGCGEEPAAESSAATEAAITAADALAMYAKACEPIEAASDLTLTVNFEETRSVGGETYSEKMVSTLSFSGIGTQNMTASVNQQLAFGSYETQYAEFYLDGKAYCRTSGSVFCTTMDAEEFLERQVPALLLDASLYGSVSAHMADGNMVIAFSVPQALEGWVLPSDDAQLVAASGTVTLDAAGSLLSSAYLAQYTCGPAVYDLNITVAPVLGAAETMEEELSELPADCAVLSCFDAPRLIVQVVGDVFTSQSMSVSYTETLYSAAYSRMRTQTSSFDTYGSGSDFMAQTRYEVSVTDYTNTATSKSEVKTFRDGSCTVSINGADAAPLSGETADSMRSGCEDSILAALFTPNYLAGAELTDTGDFLCIRFTGNDAFADSLCSSIYSIFNANLDTWAESFTTPTAGGYLCINKRTGLPTALGISLSRIHIIDGVSYALNYQLDQIMQLSSSTAYETITGEAPEEAVSEKTATPLFYRVTGESGQNMWLLGTIHVGDERTAALPQEIYDAFGSADSLAVEYNLNTFEETVLADPNLMAQLTEAYYYADGSTVKSHIDDALFAQLQDLMLASGRNSVDAQYYRTVIWWKLIGDFYLQQDYSLSIDKGLDQRLLDMAETQNKPVLEMESGLSRLQMLAGFSDNLQAQLLAQLLEAGAQNYCRETGQLYELWCSGDEAALTDLLVSDNAGLELALYEEYEKAVNTDRNAAMLESTKGYLESGKTVFCAVGLAHLLGEDGLVEALRSAGYTVELVAYD